MASVNVSASCDRRGHVIHVIAGVSQSVKSGKPRCLVPLVAMSWQTYSVSALRLSSSPAAKEIVTLGDVAAPVMPVVLVSTAVPSAVRPIFSWNV
jgi:hypothetical protein